MRENTKRYIKFYGKRIIRVLLHVFWLLPIKRNLIVFETFGGKQFSCNPYYVYEYMRVHYPEYTYIWSLRNPKTDTRCKNVVPGSIGYFLSVLRAKIYITNDGIYEYLPFRKKQIVINTWHGGGSYKKCMLSLPVDQFKKSEILNTSKTVTFFLSSSQRFTEVMTEAFALSRDKFLDYGMPRNDLIIDPVRRSQMNLSVRRQLKISNDTFIVLYAPTFRNTPDNPDFDLTLDFDLVAGAISKRFNTHKVCILLRGHHSFEHLTHKLPGELQDDGLYSIQNVTSYPFMQELICAADMCISDYSSTIWDFSFTYRPCMLYVPDLYDYENDRSFYIPINQWGFPIAQNNEDVVREILNFDIDRYMQRMIDHHDYLKSYEQGNATQKLADHINRIVRTL